MYNFTINNKISGTFGLLIRDLEKMLQYIKQYQKMILVFKNFVTLSSFSIKFLSIQSSFFNKIDVDFRQKHNCIKLFASIYEILLSLVSQYHFNYNLEVFVIIQYQTLLVFW